MQLGRVHALAADDVRDHFSFLCCSSTFVAHCDARRRRCACSSITLLELCICGHGEGPFVEKLLMVQAKVSQHCQRYAKMCSASGGLLRTSAACSSPGIWWSS